MMEKEKVKFPWLWIFAILICLGLPVVCLLLWTPLKLNYLKSRLYSNDKKARIYAVEHLVDMGERGKAMLVGFCGLENEAGFIVSTWKGLNKEPEGSVRDDPIYNAVDLNYPTAVQLLLDNGSQVEGDWFRKKPLYNAAGLGHLEVVKILVKNGADIEARDGYRRHTPLMIAVRYGHIDVVTYLIAHGADVNATYNWSISSPRDPRSYWTALDMVRCDDENMKKLLIEHGAKTWDFVAAQRKRKKAAQLKKKK
jgi:hypothetical protein